MLEELLKIADNQGLTGHESFRKRKVHWFIDLDVDGNYLSFSPTTAGGKNKDERGKQYKTPVNLYCQAEKGEIKSVCTNQSNWLPDFLTYPANELFSGGVYGEKDDKKIKKLNQSRAVIFEAAEALPQNRLLSAIKLYLQKDPDFPVNDLSSSDDKEKETLLKRFNEDKERISFRVNGKIVFLDEEIQKWWISRNEKVRNEVLELLPDGKDFILPDIGKLTEFFPIVFNNIPFASFDKEPFISYGLGKQTTPLRVETSEKSAAALNWMLADENYNITMGDITAVFWAKNKDSVNSTGFVSLISKNDTLEVKDFFNNIWGRMQPSIEKSNFYAVLIAPKRGRFSIYSWHTETLKEAEEKIKSYFQIIVVPLKGEDTTFSVSELAGVTVRKPKKGQPAKPLPNTYISLFETALFGFPVTYKLFKSVLIRQGVEMAKGAEEKDFEKRLAARTAVIKLFFKIMKGGDTMEQKRHDIENNPGYLCGRLLAILDKIHQEAHRESGGTNNSPANRVYAIASKTPALIFPRLCNLTRHHLNKIGGGWANCLEYGIPKEERGDGVEEDFEGLAKVCSRLKETIGKEFPRILSLEDQGRFAIGFYYERERSRRLKTNKKDTGQNIQTNNQIEEEQK
ncbi:MAG: type I-C CRISPR-associated protein Cas8c/Csd1 [Planctomycetia bacterium]|uniref:Type I-C CRISPR-associated protein Cas8c/Csd1 n=1 Tax=Candidatus Brocadia sapporoensis TaxID=392547 RepID=A0A1V6M3N2_9BACT|nr:type I-C CRISPR-associated protein Cas8c/Csd1 [Candidatus Brocadia sapporoensis]MCC7238389.1 type I-C CRISPR-associated protein Cas8c/Csd1 [Candidatus Brocadia sp.]OQD47034.1 hypothetical protein BIY37_00045 [Candidatus Brocadia sapporoensis]QOJ06446.1 MAG: type I-C CRISPR-associated protein Cas8c/Csd1 [Planctomycetia bacterium]HQU32403.1 type I-C CRISPR-associated protein Cas8c/Csd1 [Candidatus Brocadia sapporoensis]